MKTKKHTKKMFDFFLLSTIEPYGTDPETADDYIVFATSSKVAREIVCQTSDSDVWQDSTKTTCRKLKNVYMDNTKSHIVMCQNRSYNSYLWTSS
jgi:hypothetical protein